MKVDCAFGEVETELIFDETDTEILFDEICAEDIDDETIVGVGAGEASVNERTDSNRRKERGMNIISNVQ